jgi:hypothetical protein
MYASDYRRVTCVVVALFALLLRLCEIYQPGGLRNDHYGCAVFLLMHMYPSKSNVRLDMFL